MEIMQALEPIQIEKNTTLFAEQDEITEVYFLMNGIYEIGFTANLEKFFPMRYQHYSVIGAYAVTYLKRSAFIYRTFSFAEGYFVRRKYWKIIMDRNDQNIISEFKLVILDEFENKIRRKMNYFKLIELKK
jgi:hypothetical protein